MSFWHYSEDEKRGERMDERRIFLLLKKAFTKIGLLADYVTEQGDGYTKWNSGKMEQWGAVTVSASSGTASRTISFPKEFINTSYRFLLTGNTNANVSDYIGECDSAANKKRTTKTTIVTVKKTGGAHGIGIDWYAIGYWKTPTWGVIQSLLQYLGGGNYAIV